MGIDFRRPRHIRGFRLGEVLIFGPGIGRVLVEKTASGAIAHIEDGADSVPLKNWLVTLPASLDGYTEVNGVRTGKNLLPNNIEDGLTGGITYTKNNDGSISCVGTVTNINSTRVIATNVKLPVGSYFLHGADNSIRMRCTIYDKDGTYTARNDTGNGVTVSVTATTDYLEFRILARTLGEVVNTTVFPQFEVGSTATAYEAYEAPTTYTANLGRTVYGADVDLVSGQGTETHGYIDLGSLNWVKVTSGQTPYFSASSALNPAYKWASQNSNVLCNNYSYASIGSSGSDEGFFVTNASYVRIRDANYESMTADQFKTAITGTILVYELATGTAFTFTPITPTPETALGVNNFWADEGDSQVTYYAYAD